MLQSIRDKVTGYVAIGVIFLITIPFSFWGIDSYFTASDNPEVAEVGGVEITKSELDRAYDQQLQQLRRLMGESFREDQLNPESFRRDVLDNLIQQKALEIYIHKSGLAVDDGTVSAYVRNLPVFQVDGQFSQQTYLSLLSRQGLSPAAFENDVRASLAVDQIREAVLESAFLSGAVVANTYRLLQQKRELSYLRFEADALKSEVAVSDADVQKRYERDTVSYSLPERVKLSYVLLDKSAYDNEPPPEEAMLRDMYETEKSARFSKPEQRRARHILIRVDDDTSDEQAREKLQNLASQIEGGADFAELAKSSSEDPGSRDKGGALDPVTRGMLDPAFEDALFALEPNQVSDPLRTDFGWHLIRLEEVIAAAVLPFEDAQVQEELSTLYQTKMREEHFRQDVERMGQLAYEHDASLDAVAEGLGLPLQQTDWVTRNKGEGIAANAAVRQSAFSDEVLQDGYNSRVLDLDSTRKLVVRVAEHEAARVRPIEEVRDDIVEELKTEGARALARERGLQALEKLRNGASLSALSQGAGVSMKQVGMVGRDSEALDVEAIEMLFSMPRPVDGKPSRQGLVLSNGDFAVVQMGKVEDPDFSSVAEAERRNTERNLKDRIAGAEFEAFLAALREELDVEIHENRL